mgnify:FL=1
MPLSSYILKPMQRITKYPLLVERVSALHYKMKVVFFLVFLIQVRQILRVCIFEDKR